MRESAGGGVKKNVNVLQIVAEPGECNAPSMHLDHCITSDQKSGTHA